MELISRQKKNTKRRKPKISGDGSNNRTNYNRSHSNFKSPINNTTNDHRSQSLSRNQSNSFGNTNILSYY